MVCDICRICHSHIDYAQLDEVYPHLSDGSYDLPPAGMSLLEEDIYWGTICLDCARSAEASLPENVGLPALPPNKQWVLPRPIGPDYVN